MSRFRSPAGRIRTSVAGVVAAAVATGGMATVPAAAATPASAPGATTAAATSAAPAPAAAALAPPTYDVLVFSKTTGFRHGSIGAGIRAVERLGAQYGFTVDATEDATQFTAANLAQYEAVVWMSTTSDVLNDTQQAAFEDYIQAGGGYVGVHAASDTEYTWPWYGDLVGAYFQSHPAGTPTATINVEDKTTASSCALPDRWERTDEWYNFQSKDNPVVNGGGADYSPRVNPNINVIATLDESTYVEGDGNATDDDHPIAWYQEFDGGRSFYTGGGHTDASFSEPLFRLHLLGGIQYAAGEAPDACTPPAPTDASFEQVTLAKGVDKVGEPMSISVLPDGRVLHNARDGRIFLTDLEGNTTLLHDVPIYSHDEDGLQSLTVSPTFEEDGWVYLYYAPPLDTPAGDAPNEGTAAAVRGLEGPQRPDPDEDGRRRPGPLDRAGAAARRRRPRHLLPRRWRHRLRRRRQPLPVDRRRLQPVRLRRLRARSTSAPPATRRTTRSAARPTPTTCAARCCASRPTRPRRRTRSRRATSSTSRRRPPTRRGPRSTRWASATRSG